MSKRAAVYLRMSKDQQEASIPAQRTAIRAWAGQHGWKIVKEYRDEGISGDATERRTGFHELVKDATSGKFDAILVWDLSRLGRFDSLEAGYWLFPLRQAGIRIYTLDHGELRWDDFAGRIVWGVEQEMRHSYLRNLARDVLRGKRQAAAAGTWCGGPAPIGYELKDGKLIPVPRLARFVRGVFADYLSGLSLRSICERLNAGPIRPARGGPWLPVTVRKMLTTETYLGRLVYGKESRSKYVTVAGGQVTDKCRNSAVDDPDERIVIDGWCEPLIDPETFSAVAAEMRRRRTCTTPVRNGGDFLFTGVLYCGCCGNRMQGQRISDGITGVAYICQTWSKQGRTACQRNTVRQAALLGAVVDRLAEELEHPAARRELLAGAVELGDGNAGRPDRLDQARQELASAEASVKSLKARLCEVDSDMIPIVQERLREAIATRKDALDAVSEAKKSPAIIAKERTARSSRARELVLSLKLAVSQATALEIRTFLRLAIQRIDVWAVGIPHGKRQFWKLDRGRITLADQTAELVHSAPAHGTSYMLEFRGKTA